MLKRKTHPDQIRKRDNSLVDYDINRIIQAIFKAMSACGTGSRSDAEQIAKEVNLAIQDKNEIDVEMIQDIVEKKLSQFGFFEVAKAYILYREEHKKQRQKKLKIETEIDVKTRDLFFESSKYFKNAYNLFVYVRTYAKWLEKEQRRECWIETVDRYIDFMKENLGFEKLTLDEYNDVREAILKQEIVPSMRLLQFAGPAARRSNICAFNCSFIAPCCIKDLVDILFILMEGAGVGFSVESANVYKFPQIAYQIENEPKSVFVVEDSSEGWCEAFKHGLACWFNGHDTDFDYSLVRPEGSRLKIKGGKASGPGPLNELLMFSRNIILSKQGKLLSPINLHDIICYIGKIVVVGGVRRASLISLSDLDDVAMREAKNTPNWQESNSQRHKANNSAVYETKPSCAELMTEWLHLILGGSGERGIFNKKSLLTTLPERRLEYFVKKGIVNQDRTRFIGQVGCNPCGEIILQSRQFCNLTEVIAKPHDTVDTLKRKTKLATIMGTYQATLTNFPYIDPKWKQVCEEESLLGVSISGQWDCPVVRNASVLRELKEIVIETNIEYAKRFGINQATATTCVKPSGTTSQVVGCSSGLHQPFAPYYIRRVRISEFDSLFQMLKDQGVPWQMSNDDAKTAVVEFPIALDIDNSYEMTAIEQLEYWKGVKINYTEHNPSCTIYVKPDEWLKTLNWIYDNWEYIGGLTFFPKFETMSNYQLLPFEKISQEKYLELANNMPKLNFSHLKFYEKEDNTSPKSEPACAGGICEL